MGQFDFEQVMFVKKKKKLAIVTVWLSLLSLISRFMNDCRIFYYS